MDNRITFELLQAARAYRVRSAKLLARVGLYPGQDALLKLLDQHGRMTMGEAAAALSIQPPTVTKMVNRLSAAGLVRTEVMDRDRRKISISMTESGRRSTRSTPSGAMESRRRSGRVAAAQTQLSASRETSAERG